MTFTHHHGWELRWLDQKATRCAPARDAAAAPSDSLSDIDRAVTAQIKYQRACQAAALAAGSFLAELDRINHEQAATCLERHDGLACRGLEPPIETAMCELRAKLAEIGS